LAGCDCCGRDVDGAVLRVLEQIVALPDALGAHACECGHPEMRRVPDGVFHCPACGSEVLPFKAFPRRVRYSKLRHPNPQPDESPLKQLFHKSWHYVMEIERR
jgi:hypothetical protein